MLARCTLAGFVAVSFGAHCCTLTSCFDGLRSAGKVAAMTQKPEAADAPERIAGCTRAHRQVAGCPWQPTTQTEGGSGSMTA